MRLQVSNIETNKVVSVGKLGSKKDFKNSPWKAKCKKSLFWKHKSKESFEDFINYLSEVLAKWVTEKNKSCIDNFRENFSVLQST